MPKVEVFTTGYLCTSSLSHKVCYAILICICHYYLRCASEKRRKFAKIIQNYACLPKRDLEANEKSEEKRVILIEAYCTPGTRVKSNGTLQYIRNVVCSHPKRYLEASEEKNEGER